MTCSRVRLFFRAWAFDAFLGFLARRTADLGYPVNGSFSKRSYPTPRGYANEVGKILRVAHADFEGADALSLRPVALANRRLPALNCPDRFAPGRSALAPIEGEHDFDRSRVCPARSGAGRCRGRSVRTVP